MNAITIPIDDPTVCIGLIALIVKTIETPEGIDKLLEDGCDPRIVDALRHLKARDLIEIAARMKGGFQCSFNAPDLGAEVSRLAAVRNDQALCEYFIRHGASRKLVADLWRLSLDEVTRLRGLLSTDSVVDPQRPRDQHVREEIQNAWYEIQASQADLPLRTRIYMLHQRFLNLSIDAVYSIATEFDDAHTARHKAQGTPNKSGVHRAQ